VTSEDSVEKVGRSGCSIFTSTEARRNRHRDPVREVRIDWRTIEADSKREM